MIRQGLYFAVKKNLRWVLLSVRVKNIFDYVNETQNTQFFKKKLLIYKRLSSWILNYITLRTENLLAKDSVFSCIICKIITFDVLHLTLQTNVSLKGLNGRGHI